MRIIPVILLLLVVLLASCDARKMISSPDDYERYLAEGSLVPEKEKLEKETSFWEDRLKKDTGSYVNMLELATCYLQQFKLTGAIALLQKGDSLLKRSSAKLNDSDPEILYSLSQQSIARHRFRDAGWYATLAGQQQGDKYTVRLLQFDASMELGKYPEAITHLESFKDKTSFDYLIRKAKWEDHQGNLETAIVLMEQAFEKVKEKKKPLYCWALSNLADMYGHAGRIGDSYKAYLRVLEKDPVNLYCLKGIAWIAYAHDRDFKAARRILDYILRQAEMPELFLVLAEIAESENNPALKKEWLRRFVTTVSRPGYGDMYNKYLIEIYAEESGNLSKAEELAQKELSNRFTPETCDGMAWVLYRKGEFGKAYDFAKNYVHQLTYEPGVLVHTAHIYAANGREEEAKRLLEECLGSAFELGPVVTAQIREKLRSL